MRILLIGSGGRENALAWKLAQSPKMEKLYIAPGNPGTALIGENVNLAVEDIAGLLKFALEEKIDLTLVGPEVPLVLGIVDRFKEKGLCIFGPSQRAAALEGSKAEAKRFMNKYGIPTAAYGEYTTAKEAIEALPQFGLPVVIKADGLAAGKGVVIAENHQDAVEALVDMLTYKRFGAASEKIILESFLKGIEASMICFVDGSTILPMETAQDYKKALDDDKGPNTGGMGAYSPSVLFDDTLMEKVRQRVLNPFIEGVKAEAYDYHGMIFIGLMIDGDDIQVLEFNVRFGDPETQAILPRLKNDLVDVCMATVEERLSEIDLTWTREKSLAVVLTSSGYPEAYPTGDVISGIENVTQPVAVFHAGTRMREGELVTSGGRVLNVMVLADDLNEARAKVYQAVDKINYNGKTYRKDIGLVNLK